MALSWRPNQQRFAYRSLSHLLGRVQSCRNYRSSSSTSVFVRYLRGGTCDNEDHDGTSKRHFASSSSSCSSLADEVLGEELKTRRITYLTDVEGDRDYLTRYVEQSKVLCFRPCHSRYECSAPELICESPLEQKHVLFPYTHCIDFIRPECNDCVVYGGDVWDQGGSDLYVIRQLLDLKARHPESVYFVMGNRDINKMRLSQELQPDTNGKLPLSYGVYWLRGSGLEGDPNLGAIYESSVERLQWILRNTMGSPRAFEHRRWELEQELLQLGVEGRAVRDEDVVNSYRQSTRPEGEMGLYLANAHLVARLGDVLFLHGSLPLNLNEPGYQEHLWDDLTFAMPWLPKSLRATDFGISTIDDWLLALNKFASENIGAWRRRLCTSGSWSATGGYDHTTEDQPFGQLLQYGMGWTPDGVRNPTVVYSGWCVSGVPRNFVIKNGGHPFAKHTRDFFQRSGIQLICSGHQPQGDMPNPIRVPIPECNRTSWVLSCDTSYSGDLEFLNLPGDPEPRENPGRGQSRSGRGMNAVSEVLIEQSAQTGDIVNVHWHGRLCDGTPYRTASLDFSHSEAQPDSTLLVGSRASGPGVPLRTDSPKAEVWWTRAAFMSKKDENVDSFLLSTCEGL
jgi:hypothetical protein